MTMVIQSYGIYCMKNFQKNKIKICETPYIIHWQFEPIYNTPDVFSILDLFAKFDA